LQYLEAKVRAASLHPSTQPSDLQQTGA